MLVLSRKRDEAVIVDGVGSPDRKLRVTVLEIKAGSVRLGFDADMVVPIHRLEVWERMQAHGQPDCRSGVPLGSLAGSVTQQSVIERRWWL